MIYLVEDDNNIRELVAYTLNSAGMEAMGFASPSAFWKQMQSALPQLVLLDIMLPDEDGLSILKKLRENPRTKHLPIMMLTAKGSEYDKVIGLDAGADDYVAKPFGMMELLARIRALLRRTNMTQTKTSFQIGALYVNIDKHIVKVQGESISLTFKEFEILCLLLKNRGIVMTRDQILNIIWGYAFDGENRTVDVHVRTLRQKLGECGSVIETVRGIGYKIGE